MWFYVNWSKWFYLYILSSLTIGFTLCRVHYLYVLYMDPKQTSGVNKEPRKESQSFIVVLYIHEQHLLHLVPRPIPACRGVGSRSSCCQVAVTLFVLQLRERDLYISSYNHCVYRVVMFFAEILASLQWAALLYCLH